jgi:hypothetical protein
MGECWGGGGRGLRFFSGDRGSGIFAAVEGDCGVVGWRASLFVGDGGIAGGLDARMVPVDVKTFSSPLYDGVGMGFRVGDC